MCTSYRGGDLPVFRPLLSTPEPLAIHERMLNLLLRQRFHAGLELRDTDARDTVLADRPGQVRSISNGRITTGASHRTHDVRRVAEERDSTRLFRRAELDVGFAGQDGHAGRLFVVGRLKQQP